MLENERGLFQRRAGGLRKGAVRTWLEVRQWLVYISELTLELYLFGFYNERSSASESRLCSYHSPCRTCPWDPNHSRNGL